MNGYEQKLEARRERLLARAQRKQAEASAQGARADQIANVIPMGQPILIGHHSERRHRRDLERMRSAIGKSVQLGREADDLKRRADAVGTAGISSDDPEALAKLRAELAEAEANHATMVRANAAFRKALKTGDEKAAWRAVAEIVGTEQAIETAKRQALMWSSTPRPPYGLTNSSANIRRVKARIAELEREAERAEQPAKPIEGPRGIRAEERPDINRVAVVFPCKPSEPERAIMKRWGFRWSPREGAWLRHLNAQGRGAVKLALEALGKVQP